MDEEYYSGGGEWEGTDGNSVRYDLLLFGYGVALALLQLATQAAYLLWQPYINVQLTLRIQMCPNSCALLLRWSAWVELSAAERAG